MITALARDTNSNQVINTDVVALNKYKLERALHRKVKRLTEDLAEVKLCLVSITERLDKIENN